MASAGTVCLSCSNRQREQRTSSNGAFGPSGCSGVKKLEMYWSPKEKIDSSELLQTRQVVRVFIYILWIFFQSGLTSLPGQGLAHLQIRPVIEVNCSSLFWINLRSPSTIMCTNSGNVILGSQPSRRLALAGFPTSRAVSAERKFSESCTT